MSAHSRHHQMNRSPFEGTDPGTGKAIEVDRWGLQVPLNIDASGETNTMAAPARAGQRVTIVAASVESSATREITVASPGVAVDSYTSMLFDAVNEAVILESIPSGSSSRWTVIVADGVTLS